MSLSQKLGLTDLGDLSGQRVLIRVDFNVPQDASGKVTNPQRIVAALPTIKYALDKKAKAVILMSHLGRPDGKVVSKYSLKPVAAEAEKLLGKPVTFLPDCVGADTEAAIAKASAGQVFLLENLRFHIEEEGKGVNEAGEKVKADKEKVEAFRQGLTRLGDVFVNDAFGTCHRAHASMVGVKLDKRAAGMLVKKELDYFAAVLENPKRPFLGILGGSKVVDKIGLIDAMLDRVNTLIVGGGMSYTLAKVQDGVKIGSSLFDADGAQKVPGFFEKAKAKGVKIILPVDHVAGSKFGADAETKVVTNEEGIPDGWMGLDIGPKTQELFRNAILESKLILFNGPPGVFELEPFAAGSKAVLDACVEAEKKGTTVVIGGGDSATLAAKYNAEEKLSHVSSGGGASISLLQGEVLPGVDALSNKA